MCNLKDVNRGVNRTILQISLLLLLNVFSIRKCIRLIVKITEQNKCLFHNFYRWFWNSTDLKELFHRVLNANTRSFPFLAPPPTPTPPPPQIHFNVGISNALNLRPIQISYATFACDNSLERRPTLIKGRGICLHIYHILKLQNPISVLNVLVGFELTLCEPNLNFGKTKYNAIRQKMPQNWTEGTKFSAK